MKRLLGSCWGVCLDWFPLRTFFPSAKPYADDGDSEDEREEVLHYFKEAVRRNETGSEDQPLVEISSDDSHLQQGTGGAASLLHPKSPSILVSRCSEDSCGTESPFSISGSPVRSLQLLGKLMITAQYFPEKAALELTLRDAYDLALPDADSQSQFRLSLLPEKKQKFKTQILKGKDPKIDQMFTLKSIRQEEMAELGVRIRVYRPLGRGRRDQMLAEATLRLCLIDARSKSCTHHLLELALTRDFSAMRASVSDFSVSSRRDSSVDDVTGGYTTQPIGMSPEILLSLCYNDVTGKLIVGVEKGSCFGTKSKAPDTMVKLTLLSPYGEEIGKSKTPVRKASSSPTFSDIFVFQVPADELAYVSLLVQVFCFIGVWKRRVPLGWLSLGQNSTSKFEEEHWKDMSHGMGITISKWHVLVEP